jgi:hypothetical protein
MTEYLPYHKNMYSIRICIVQGEMVTNVYGYLESGYVFYGWRSEFFLGAKFRIVANLSLLLLLLLFLKRIILSQYSLVFGIFFCPNVFFGDSFVKCVYSWLI